MRAYTPCGALTLPQLPQRRSIGFGPIARRLAGTKRARRERWARRTWSWQRAWARARCWAVIVTVVDRLSLGAASGLAARRSCPSSRCTVNRVCPLADQGASLRRRQRVRPPTQLDASSQPVSRCSTPDLVHAFPKARASGRLSARSRCAMAASTRAHRATHTPRPTPSATTMAARESERWEGASVRRPIVLSRVVHVVRSVFALPGDSAARALAVPGLRAEVENLLDEDIDSALRRVLADTSRRPSMNGPSGTVRWALTVQATLSSDTTRSRLPCS